jgi:hypothetical protein
MKISDDFDRTWKWLKRTFKERYVKLQGADFGFRLAVDLILVCFDSYCISWVINLLRENI